MYMEQTHILALSFMCPKIYVRLTFYFFFPEEHQRNSPFFSAFCPNPNLTMQWLLNITYCLVAFECCCGPPVQVGVGRVFGLLPWEQRRAHSKICKHQMLPLSLSLLLLLHLNIPAVCLSALFQWWCETWRQGAWACSSCQLTLWPPARHLSAACQRRSRPLLGITLSRLPVPGEGESFHVLWIILNSNAHSSGRREQNLSVNNSNWFGINQTLQEHWLFLWHFIYLFFLIIIVQQNIKILIKKCGKIIQNVL